eukprot:9941043-Alexandrium_andersonii.AAC.1
MADAGHYLEYYFQGQHICEHAWKGLWGIGSSRHRRLRQAVLQGCETAPLDMRYIKAAHSKPPSEVRMRAHKFLQTLYERVAEPLPEAGEDEEEEQEEEEGQDPELHEPPDPYAVSAVGISEPPLKHAQGPKRYLPPGSIFELWRQFCDMDCKCGYRAFRLEFHAFGLLAFRMKRQHA